MTTGMFTELGKITAFVQSASDNSKVLGTVEPGREGWLPVSTLSLAPVLVGQGARLLLRLRRKTPDGSRLGRVASP